MNGLAVLIPLALMMGLIGLVAFFWALRRGQFDDLDGAANRILIDDEDLPLKIVPGPSAAPAEAGNEGGKGQGAP